LSTPFENCTVVPGDIDAEGIRSYSGGPIEFAALVSVLPEIRSARPCPVEWWK
jgi:hypothetical protein